MYHPVIVQASLDRRIDEVRKRLPSFDVPARTPAESIARAQELPLLNDDGSPPSLSAADQVFILQELCRTACDAKYWLETYAMIKVKAQALQALTLLESQQVMFDRIAAVEKQCAEGLRYDGLLFVVLKARQLGASTLAEALLLHRLAYTPYSTALVASDEEANSAHLFDMAERVYDNLPWWLRPQKTFHVKNHEMVFGEIDSEFICRWGRSMGGGKNADNMGRGQVGRSWTIPLFHISELATWENPNQLDEALFGSVPVLPSSMGFLESTGRGRHNWWHQRWSASVKGLGRFSPIFIPWYAETMTYRRPAPLGWTPQGQTLAHADAAIRLSQQWCGRVIRLDKDQLYWWETERADYAERGMLSKFLAEYCADPEDAFQNLEGSVFGGDLLYKAMQNKREHMGVFDIG